MTAPSDALQYITVLSPLSEVVARLDALVSPVAAQDTVLDAAIGAVLATDIIASSDMPQHASALSDGWALASEQIVDASSYAPAIVTPAPQWVDAGQQMPAGADVVLPFDALAVMQAHAEVFASAAHGEGVLPARGDVEKGIILRRSGERLRLMDVAILRALKLETVSIRAPRVKIVALSAKEPNADFISPVIANAVRANGGIPEILSASTLEAALSDSHYDAVITIGGTGSGRNDKTVKSLLQLGKLEFHGFGVSPGQTAALGSINGRPVLMLPGRLEAALAVFLVVGRKMMVRLTNARESEVGQQVSLLRKIASTIGLTEVVFVRRNSNGIEPLGSGLFSLRALMQADGWVLVPAESEGASAGTVVEMRKLP